MVLFLLVSNKYKYYSITFCFFFKEKAVFYGIYKPVKEQTDHLMVSNCRAKAWLSLTCSISTSQQMNIIKPIVMNLLQNNSRQRI